MDPNNLDTQKINTPNNTHNTSNTHNTHNTNNTHGNLSIQKINKHNTFDRENTVEVDNTVNAVEDDDLHLNQLNVSPEIKANNTNVNNDENCKNVPEIKVSNNAVKINTLEENINSLKENTNSLKEIGSDMNNLTLKRVNNIENKSNNVNLTNSTKDNIEKNNNIPETEVSNTEVQETEESKTNVKETEVSSDNNVNGTEKRVELDNVNISKIIKEIIANNRANIIPEARVNSNPNNGIGPFNMTEIFQNTEVKNSIEPDVRYFSKYDTVETTMVTGRLPFDAQITFRRTKTEERIVKFDNRLKNGKRQEIIKSDKIIEKLQQLIVNNVSRRELTDKRELQIKKEGFERRDQYERNDPFEHREQYDSDQMTNEQYIRQQMYYRDDIQQGMIGIPERRGGLSWIRTSNGNLLPQIENTWLKHIITSLQSNKLALMNFFNNLEKCLIESVQFLYKEGIKPYLGDVANQMKRSICDNFWSAAEVAYVSLHCKNTVKLNIELRVKGEMGWVVYLIKEPTNFKGFVDTHSTVNSYDDYYWRQLNLFASSILTNNNDKVKDDKDFNGGRYAFAERLKNEVEAFKNMRLGEVVHLVQLAIYSGIFVYTQRILLPVSACEKTAQELFPKLKKSRYPICTCINEVLKIVSLLVDNRKNGLVLAQLKQQFMLQFNRELNPLSFGYRKLQNLLLSDLFNQNYHLFVPVDSPHRTHIQHSQYPIPSGCKIFKQSKLQFDPLKFPTPLTDYYDQYYNICAKHSKTGNTGYRGKECTCLWKLEYDTLPPVVKDSIKDYLD
uniref:OST-HTH Associated domain containing protein, putative n=1 Tax=Theileria annulata TaxID=5874 RepID=A0A3B0MTJ1_THEAN